MATQQSPGGQARAAQRPVNSDGLGCVVRTRRDKFATTRVQRVQRGREPAFVEAEQRKQEARHDVGLTGAMDEMRLAESSVSAGTCF